MGSIRPVVTITVLLIVGAFLYSKINEGPARQAGGPGAGNQLSEGVPPLNTNGGSASLAQDSSAPAWPPANSPAPPAANAPGTMPANADSGAPGLSLVPGSAPSSEPSIETAKDGMPEVPPIPELPELPSTATTSTPTAQPTPLPMETPKTIPDGRYGEEAGPKLGIGASTEVPAVALPAADAPQNPTPANTLPIGSTDPATAGGLAPQSATPAGPVTSPASPPAAQQNSLRSPASAAPAPVETDRYGLPISSPSQPAPVASPLASPVSSPIQSTPPAATSATAGATFAASWPAIQASLDRGDLKQAHQLLSKWHGDESLAPAESEKVETLLGQLAGTVIYSPEHQLEPARVVKPGETLDSIAKEYNVPTALLAKINSIASPDQLRPGQPLKVVRGPFTAIVDLHRSELTLEVDGRYAGTFAVAVPPGVNVTEGQWTVDQKLGGARPVTAAAYTSTPAAADRTIVLRSAANPGGAPGGPILTIASGAAAPGASALRVAPQDAEDLSDILSIGSRVTVRR